MAAMNYTSSLSNLQRIEEAMPLMRKSIPVMRRVLGEDNGLTLKMRKNYARALYLVADATPDDVREAVTTLEDVERIARRVFGGSHPITEGMEPVLRTARAVLSAREAGIPYAFKMVS